MFAEAQFVKALQIEPELSARAEEMPKAESRVSGHGALLVEDLRIAVCRNPQAARKPGRAHLEDSQFFGQVLSWIAAS